MSLKINWYKSKLQCCDFRILYAMFMVATKKMVKEYTQKAVGQELKCFTTKKKINRGSSAGNKGQKVIRHIENKQENNRGLSLSVSHKKEGNSEVCCNIIYIMLSGVSQSR